jgi:hypothetical protein
MSHPIMVLNPRPKTKKRTVKARARPVRKTKRKTPRRNSIGLFVKKSKPKTARKKSTIRTSAKKVRVIKRTEGRKMSKAITKTAPRRNVVRRSARVGKVVRRTVHRAKGAFSGLNFRSGIKDSAILALGMFLTQFGCKRFSSEFEANLGDPQSWSAMSYVKGGIAGTVAAIAGNMLRPGIGQKLLEGSFAHLLFQLAQNYGIQPNDTMKSWFGQDPMNLPEVQFDAQGNPLMMGAWGQVPITEDYRMLGDEVVSEDRYGDVQASPGRLGNAELIRQMANAVR